MEETLVSPHGQGEVTLVSTTGLPKPLVQRSCPGPLVAVDLDANPGFAFYPLPILSLFINSTGYFYLFFYSSKPLLGTYDMHSPVQNTKGIQR